MHISCRACIVHNRLALCVHGAGIEDATLKGNHALLFQKPGGRID